MPAADIAFGGLEAFSSTRALPAVPGRPLTDIKRMRPIRLASAAQGIWKPRHMMARPESDDWSGNLPPIRLCPDKVAL